MAGIFPINSQVLGQLSKPIAKSRSKSPVNTTRTPENTPYTKCGLRREAQFALKLIKLASEGEVCNWYYALLMLLSTPLPKPILLVQSYSIRLKIFVL